MVIWGRGAGARVATVLSLLEEWTRPAAMAIRPMTATIRPPMTAAPRGVLEIFLTLLMGDEDGQSPLTPPNALLQRF